METTIGNGDGTGRGTSPVVTMPRCSDCDRWTVRWFGTDRCLNPDCTPDPIETLRQTQERS